jgi:hypothetical protein
MRRTSAADEHGQAVGPLQRRHGNCKEIEIMATKKAPAFMAQPISKPAPMKVPAKKSAPKKKVAGKAKKAPAY